MMRGVVVEQARAGRAAPLLSPDTALLEAVRAAALHGGYVSMGSRRLESVHEFYRYPARFSPSFARAVIQAFSSPGKLVLDPFVGGGTTLVESRLLARPAIGADLSPLATFVTRAKTALPSAEEVATLKAWGSDLGAKLKLRGRTQRPEPWDRQGYFRGLGGSDTWRIRDLLVRAVNESSSLGGGTPELLARCALLRAGQWALDMRSTIPSVEEFRSTLVADMLRMVDVAEAYAGAVRAADATTLTDLPWTTVIQTGLPGLAEHRVMAASPPASLVLTSPPYPGVYVLYHRWKLQGRKEIPAPFWLAGSPDGHGMAHYTMSARARQTLDLYFERLGSAIADLLPLTQPGTWFVQLIGFSDVDAQLPRYLELLANLGFQEVRFPSLSTAADGRLWRSVPSRRWWVTATSRSRFAPHTAQEVVLVHRRA